MTGRLRAWAVEIALASAFVLLLVLVARQSGPLALDSWVTDGLPPLHGPGEVTLLTWVARVVTDAGDPIVWTVGTLLVAAVLGFGRRTWAPVRLVALPVVIEAVLVLSLKAAVGRIGPTGPGRSATFGYFPSGHTATALVCCGALAALLAVERPAWAAPLRIVVVVWALLMAAGLVYCRYHWLTDVVASFLLGLFLLRICCPGLWGSGSWRGARDDRGSRDDATPEHDPAGLREDA